MPQPTGPLKKELEFFNKNRKEYLKAYKGQFVLIKDNQLIGSFITEGEAYKNGVEKFGNEPFLIKQVLEKDETISFPALITGVINASL